MERDDVAERLFGDTYSRLSAWGQQQVDNILRVASVPAETPVVDNRATLTHENERLARELESTRMENLELWDENTELKSQLAELQAQFNPSDST